MNRYLNFDPAHLKPYQSLRRDPPAIPDEDYDVFLVHQVEPVILLREQFVHHEGVLVKLQDIDGDLSLMND